MSVSNHQPVARKKSTTSFRAGQGAGVSRPVRHLKAHTETPQMAVCARYDVLRALAHASGVEQVTLWALPNKRYQVSFRIRNQDHEWYLATLRNRSKPRALVNLGAAAHIAYGIAHAPTMIVNMSKARQK